MATGTASFMPCATSSRLASRTSAPPAVFTHEFVRTLAVVGVLNFKEEERKLFLAELTDDPQNGLDADASFDTCLAKLGKSGTWGNHVTLLAIAHQLRDQVFHKDVKIVVYNTTGSPMEVKSWNDSLGDPAESTVVTLYLALEGEVHYYSTQASACAAEERGVMDGDGDGSGSKRVALGSQKDGDPEGSDGSGDENDDSSMVTSGNDDDDGDDSSSGDDEDGDNDEGGGEPSASRSGSIRRTGKSGQLYTSVPLSVFDAEARDTGNRSMFVVTQTGRPAGLWTMWPEGDGKFRLFPLLEGPTPGQSYVSKTPAPSREKGKEEGKEEKGRSLQGHEGCQVLNVNLDTLNHTINGPGNSTISIPLLRRISKRFKRDDGRVIDEVVQRMQKWKIQQIKECHVDLATDHDSEQLSLAESDRRLAEMARHDLGGIVNAGDVSAEEAADLERKRKRKNSDGEQTWNYGRTLHEGGRRWLLHAFLSSFSDRSKSELETFIYDAGGTEGGADRPSVQDVCEAPWDHRDVLLRFFGDAAGSGGDMELVLRSMCPRPGPEADDLCARILESIDQTATNHGITSRGLMGEAFELFSALSWNQKGTVDLRDYIGGGEVVGDQQGQQQQPARFVSCQMERCFMSGVPRESPLRMLEKDRGDIRSAIHDQVPEGSDQRVDAFVKALYDHMSRDHGYDVLVWLKEKKPENDTGEGGTRKSHFLLLQCKARSDHEANVDPRAYIADTYELQHLAKPLGCLAPLVWCSNVISNRRLSRFDMSISKGHIIPWLLPIICGESRPDDLLRRVGLSAVRLGTRMAARPVPENTLPPRLRPHQIVAAADLSAARGRGITCGVADQATGSGKTVLECEDVLRAEEESSKIRDLPSLCMVPGIDLLLQVAAEWRSWELRRKRDSGCPAPSDDTEHVTDAERAERAAWAAAGGLPCRNFYYVVCSASEDDVASAQLRVIRVAELPATLERHWRDGTLGRCRFFTTVEGGGAFWIQTRMFNRLRREQPTTPVFGVFVRDEVHTMCGVNSSAYTLGLNVPALWMPSYTATPVTEESRAKLIHRTMRAGMKSARPRGDDEVHPGDDRFEEEEEEEATDLEVEEEEDDDDQERDPGENEAAADRHSDQPSKRQRRMENTSAENIFPQVHEPGMADGLHDPALGKAVERHGLHGIQLLPRSLLFEDLQRVAARNDVLSDVFSDVLNVIRDMGSYSKVPAYAKTLEGRLGRPVAIFVVVPSASDQEGMYDVEFDFSGRNFRMLHEPTGNIKFEHLMDGSCVVLGLLNGPTGEVFSCVQFSADEPPMGAVVHDCTSFSPGTNLIGPILTRFSFAECFASGSLAKPGLALSERGLLRVPPGLRTDEVQPLLQSWAGITRSKQGEGTGVSIEDPRKVFLSSTDVRRRKTRHGGTGGHGGQERTHRVRASAHDFHCMNHLLDLFVCTVEDHGVKPVTKPIVFCPTNRVARRNLAVFCALADQRAATAEKEGNSELASVYDSIVAAHVFQSDRSAPQLRQSYQERQKLIWRFRAAERAVLFNDDVLSTGIDLPCCDCVYLLCPSTNTIVILQRWGRALRLTLDPGKVGLLAMPCTDPYEPDEDQRAELRRIGLEYGEGEQVEDRRGAFYSKFDLACRLVECAVDPRNLVLGRLISVVTGGAQGGGTDARGAERTKELGAFFTLMISRRGHVGAGAVHLSNADLLLLQQCTSVVGIDLSVLPELSPPHMWRPLKKALDALREQFKGNVTVWHSNVTVGKHTSMTSRRTIIKDLYGAETKQ